MMPKQRGAVQPVSAAIAAEERIPNEPGAMGIRWPSWSNDQGSMFDNPVVPSDDEIRFRHRANSSEPAFSNDFRAAATSANVRLWILDSHAHELEGLGVYKRWMPQLAVRSIRVVAGAIPEDVGELSPRDGALEWRKLSTTAARFVHDRFAIVDNELWHFGATVGGGHRSFNAFTRGFHAVSTQMVAFFDDTIWKRWTQQ